MATGLTLPTFEEFFLELNSVPPFPWQARLASVLTESGRWPALALPTAAGKTATIDIALYHLAAEATRPPNERRAPRRIFFVVDRRIVVDEAHARATRIADRLNSATGSSALARVAARLRSLGGEQALMTAVLRGGVLRDEQWFRCPLQPLVAVSTVDQVGSRLLFRGYGCSPRTWPIHAALTGTDALYLLDEAHLSQPFQQTLEALKERFETQQRHHGWHLPFQVGCLTATPKPGGEEFREAALDLSHPVLAPRLTTSKLALLVKAPTTRVTATMPRAEARNTRDANRATLVSVMVELATKLAGKGDLKVAIMVNEVVTARAAHDCLRSTGHSSLLVIGRSRPLDRWNLFEGTDAPAAAFRAGAPNLPTGRGPRFLVSTQCLEVGADLDFDALVTECVALDALRQRFGRLARFGRSGPAYAAVVAGAHEVGSGCTHPVYGSATVATWNWLNDQARRIAHPCGRGPVVDFGHQAIASALPTGDELHAMLTPREDAPILLDHHLEAWAQTCPAPTAQPDPAVFLHGQQSGPLEINLVWRDLPADAPDDWIQMLDALPPLSSEALPLPRHVAMVWLTGGTQARVFDLAINPEDAFPDRDSPGLRTAVVRLLPDSEPVLCTSLEDLRAMAPSETLVVPSSAGGCDEFGWAPDSNSAVPDVALPARLLQRGKLAVVGRGEPDEEGLIPLIERAVATATVPTRAHRLHQDVARLVVQQGIESWRSDAFSDGLLFELRVRLPASVANMAGQPEDWSEDSFSRRSAKAVELEPHLREVSRISILHARSLGLPERLVEVLGLAGLLHDLGKADPAFQCLLGRATPTDRHLAKSDAYGGSVPGRHEALSTRMVQTLAVHPDPLLAHLVATHHGFARPLYPVTEPVPLGEPAVVNLEFPKGRIVRFEARQDPGLYRIEAGHAARFIACMREWGEHPLAFLETLLRLADWKASATD